MFLGALFDMDGLLLDTERVGMAVFCDLLAEYGMGRADGEALYRRIVGKSLDRVQAGVLEVLPMADVTAMDANWHAGVDAALAVTVPLRPTVTQTLDRLSAKGVPMSVVTMTQTDRAAHHLERAGILHHFTDIIGRDRVTNPKPDPEPYETGARSLGLTPQSCAAFEDSDTGTQAAVSAGCHVWQIPDIRPDDTPLPVLGQKHAKTLGHAVAEAGF